MKKLMMLAAVLMAGLTSFAQEGNQLVSVPADATIKTWHVDGVNSSFYLYDSWDEAWYQNTGDVATLSVAVSGSDIYVRGLAYWFSEAWVKGTLGDDGVVTFPERTFVGEDDYGTEYIVGSPDGETVSGFSFTYDAEAKTLTLNEGAFIVETGDDLADGYYSFWRALSLEYAEAVAVPDDLVTEEYTFTAQTLSYDYDSEEPLYTPTSFSVHVGFSGDEVYIRGLASEYYLADAWVKGTLNADGTITLPKGQYLGAAFDYYHLYFLGYDGNDVTDVTLTLSDDGRTLTTDDWVLINANRTLAYSYVTYTSVQLSKLVAVAATPAMPKIYTFTDSDFGYYTQARVPAEDEDGNPLVKSNLRLRLLSDTNGLIETYTLRAADFAYVDEDMTEIPYGFADDWDIYYDENYADYQIYLNSGDAASWSRFGMQTVYEVDGDVRESQVCWFDATAISTVPGSALNGLKVATYYNSEEDATLPVGTAIYTATFTADHQGLELHAVEGNTVPAGNAVVLLTPNDVIYNVTTAEATDAVTLNADSPLMGTDYAWSSYYDTIWMLGAEDGVTGFFEREYPYVGVHTAFISAYSVTASSPLTLQLADGETVGIAEIENGKLKIENAAYDLQGRRVESSTKKKGVTIRGGKKIVE